MVRKIMRATIMNRAAATPLPDTSPITTHRWSLSRGNETLLSKLKFKLQIDELDADLIEDVNIEMTQARETTSIYSNILESTMDTYQSIINNNMNTVMRTLTSVTIIMMIPTLITSMFGMNLVNGMESKPWGFVIAIILSIAVSGCCWWFFRHKRLV